MNTLARTLPGDGAFVIALEATRVRLGSLVIPRVDLPPSGIPVLPVGATDLDVLLVADGYERGAIAESGLQEAVEAARGHLRATVRDIARQAAWLGVDEAAAQRWLDGHLATLRRAQRSQHDEQLALFD